MTPSDLRTIRHALGLSTEGIARLVGVSSGRTVRRWEAGDRDIPGPVIVLLTAIIASEDVRVYFLPPAAELQPSTTPQTAAAPR